MKKTMTSKKKAKEETEKTNKSDQARSKKKVFNLRSFFFDFFLPLRAPESPPRGYGAADGGYACPCGKTTISEKKVCPLGGSAFSRK